MFGQKTIQLMFTIILLLVHLSSEWPIEKNETTNQGEEELIDLTKIFLWDYDYDVEE